MCSLKNEGRIEDQLHFNSNNICNENNTSKSRVDLHNNILDKD
jgi:hypothetical protein